jgi:hypothetical protein
MAGGFVKCEALVEMNYEAVYGRLIRSAQLRGQVRDGYFEVHHIQPRSLGGSDFASNLVRLTYREHFLAHWLLVKMHTGVERRKMAYALWCMGLMSNDHRITAGWQIEVVKRSCRDHRLATQRQRAEMRYFLEKTRVTAAINRCRTLRWHEGKQDPKVLSQVATDLLRLERDRKSVRRQKRNGLNNSLLNKIAHTARQTGLIRKAQSKKPRSAESQARLERWKSSKSI